MQKQPEFLLVCHARSIGPRFGWWWFSLQAEGRPGLVAHDFEQLAGMELNLLALVRGLEALECPGRVYLAVTGTELRGRLLQAQWQLAQGAPLPQEEATSPGEASWWARLQRCWRIHRVELLPRLPRELGLALDSASASARLVPSLTWRWFRLRQRRRRKVVLPAAGRRLLQSA